MSSLQLSLEEMKQQAPYNYALSMQMLEKKWMHREEIRRPDLLVMDQQRIHESSLKRQSMNDTSGRTAEEYQSCEQPSEESNDSPVVPFKIHHQWYKTSLDIFADSDDDEEQPGTLEAGAGEPKCSECEAIYRNNNNSVPHLLAMCLGLTDATTDDVDRMLIANLEGTPLYRDFLEKSLYPKAPLLKKEVKRRATSQSEYEGLTQ
jgi:hypothetical protein